MRHKFWIGIQQTRAGRRFDRFRNRLRDPAFQGVPELVKALEQSSAEKFPKIMAYLNNPLSRRVRLGRQLGVQIDAIVPIGVIACSGRSCTAASTRAGGGRHGVWTTLVFTPLIGIQRTCWPCRSESCC